MSDDGTIVHFDSVCSKHMTGNEERFNSPLEYPGGNISFGNKSKRNVTHLGEVRIVKFG